MTQYIKNVRKNFSRTGFTPLEISNSNGTEKLKGKNRRQGKSLTGFTLIELLIVIAIIGLLSSVVLASLNSARKKARDARVLSDVKQITTALEMALDASSDSKYPPSGAARHSWECLKPSGNCWLNNYDGGGTVVNALSSFMPNIPRPPAGGSGCSIYDSYLYKSDMPAWDGSGWTGPASAYLIYALERSFTGNECTVPSRNSDIDCGLSYCYKFIGYNN